MLGFIWIGEHKGKIILDCIALLEEGEGKHENIGNGGRGARKEERMETGKGKLCLGPALLWSYTPSFTPPHPVPKSQAWVDPKNDSSVTLQAL